MTRPFPCDRVYLKSKLLVNVILFLFQSFLFVLGLRAMQNRFIGTTTHLPTDRDRERKRLKAKSKQGIGDWKFYTYMPYSIFFYLDLRGVTIVSPFFYEYQISRTHAPAHAFHDIRVLQFQQNNPKNCQFNFFFKLKNSPHDFCTKVVQHKN